MIKRKIWDVIDFLSPEAKLYIKGRERYTTKFSVLMSILTFISVVSLAGYFVINYLSNIEFNAVISNEKDSFTAIDVNDFPLLFKLVDVNNNPMDPRITTASSKLWQGQGNTNNPLSLEFEQCNLEKHISKKKRFLYEKIDLTQFSCIKPNPDHNLTLYQDLSIGSYSYFNIYIKECVNSTDNGNFCLPKKEIEKKLKETVYYFEYYFTSYGVDHKNYSSPINEALYYKRQKIFYEFYFEYYDYFKKIIYLSDNGNVFEDIQDYKGIQYDSAESYSALRPTGTKTTEAGTYTIFKILVNANQIDSYKRTYPKLQVLAANIGGVVKFCVLVADFITKFFTSKFFKLELINLFFHFPKKQDNHGVVKTVHNKYNSKNGFTEVPLDSNSKKFQANHYLTDEKYTDKSSSEKFRVTKYDLFRPAICKNKNPKYEYCLEVINKKLSCDHMLEIFNQIEKLKNITLDPNQIRVFENIRNFKLEENILSLEKVKNPKKTDFEIYFNLIKAQQSRMNKKIINCFFE